MSGKKILFCLGAAIYTFSFLGCGGIQSSFHSWFNKDTQKEYKIFSPALTDSIALIWYEPRRALIGEWTSRDKPTKNWTLVKLEILSQSSDSLPSVVLKAHLRSRGRYNTKFHNPQEIRTEEWKHNGEKLLIEWGAIFKKLHNSNMGLDLQIEYQHKNYLRPNSKLKKSKVNYSISPEIFAKAKGETSLLYRSAIGPKEENVD